MNIQSLLGTAVAVGCLASAYAIMPAKAADLGGNCCADLEERIAELEATTARKGNRRVTLTVSGHVSQSIMIWDTSESVINDALGDSPTVTDHAYSQSRFRFSGQATINSDWSAGFLIEIGVSNGGDLATRHNALYIKSKTLGDFWVGQTGQASDGAISVDLGGLGSGFALGSLGNTGALIAGANFAPSPFNLNIDPAPLFAFDGSRAEVVKYVSPSVAGFTLSASLSDEDHYDVALRFAGEFGSMRIAAAGFHRNEDAARKVNGGSISIQNVPTGIYLTGTYAKSTGDQTADITVGVGGVNATFSPVLCNCDMELLGGIVGISKKMNDLGATNLGAFYDEVKLDTFDASWKRLGVVFEQNVDAAAMTMFLIYEHHDVDLGAIGDGTADVVIGGAKIRW